MSGGHFDYNQYKIEQIAYDIEHLIDNNDRIEKDEWGCTVGHNYPEEVIERFRVAVRTLKRAAAMAHRIDWLVSGDDGIDTFMKRWDEEILKIEEE